MIDYHAVDFSRELRDIDLVFDTQGGKVQEKSLEVLTFGGTLVSTVGIQDEAAVAAKGVRGVAYMAQSRTRDLDQIAALIDGGQVIPVVSQILPLTAAAKAHQILEKGHVRGKIVLQVKE